jgi:hypothetical protein
MKKGIEPKEQPFNQRRMISVKGNGRKGKDKS